MWGFVDCTRYYMSAGRPNVVLADATLLVETHEKAALLVRPGHGKSTIMRMLAGLDRPDRGTVLRDAGGWPLGYAGGFQADMTGDANIRNFAELADVDPLELSVFCYDFSELGELYHQPVKLYSSTQKARLAMAASLGIPARTYLADDKLSAGDPPFREKCMAALAERLSDCGLIFIASNPRPAKDICDSFYVLSGGEFVRCDDFDHASDFYASTSEQTAEEEADADIPTFDLV
jgi:capsular polysaccharide transport system ATP-binding protein